MAKRKEQTDHGAELERSYKQWEYLKVHGGSDPFYADGCNMNLVRNHIIYHKQKLLEQYGADYGKYPETFYRELPPEVNDNYMARSGEIRDGAREALEQYITDPSFLYLFRNRNLLTEKEAGKISLRNVLGYASGLAKAIKDGDLVTMRRHAGRPEGYLEAFSQCAGRMMQMIEDKRKTLEQMEENEQFSLFQFGMGAGRTEDFNRGKSYGEKNRK